MTEPPNKVLMHDTF